MDIETTSSPSANLIPRTPSEFRPLKSLTLVAGKRIHFPPLAAINTSSSSEHAETPIKRSLSDNLIAGGIALTIVL